MLRRPLASLVAVLTLALGIGATTAAFSVANAVLLKPLPYPEAGRLAMIRVDLPNSPATPALAPGEIADFDRQSRLLEGVGFLYGFSIYLEADGQSERAAAVVASDNILRLLRIQPHLGRGFGPQDKDYLSGEYHSVLLGYELWQRRFGGDPSVLGRSVRVEGKLRRVIGVMPKDLRLLTGPGTGIPERAGVWRPELTDPQKRGHHYLKPLARLRPDVSFSEAQAEMDSIAQRMKGEHPSFYQDGSYRFHLLPLRGDLVAPIRPTLLALLAAAVLVLVISCSNVASLVLARMASRTAEFSLRTALGAGRMRVFSQVLGESLPPALLGGALGLLLAWWAVEALVWLSPAGFPRLDDIALEWPVFAFCLACSLLAAFAVGLFPALRMTRAGAQAALRSGQRGSSPSAKAWVRRGLMTSQVALCFVLLLASGLLTRSFGNLQQVEMGFQPEGVYTFDLTVDESVPRAGHWDQLRAALTKLSALPGIEAVGAVSTGASAESGVPLGGAGSSKGSYALTADEVADLGTRSADYQYVLPGYFRALGVGLLAGQTFEAGDNDRKLNRVVVDEHLARQAWPEGGAVGRRIYLSPPSDQPVAGWYEVVGVVGHLRLHGPRWAGRPQVYMPYWTRNWRYVSFLVKQGRGSSAGKSGVDIDGGRPRTRDAAAQSIGGGASAPATASAPTSISPTPTASVPGTDGATASIRQGIGWAAAGNEFPALARMLRRQLAQVPGVKAPFNFAPLERYLDDSLADIRLVSFLFFALTGLGLLLAALGLFAVLTHLTTSRSLELGIRSALGARPAQLGRMMLSQAVWTAAGGILLGGLAAYFATRLLEGLLYGVSANDLWTWMSAAVWLALICLMASWLPARRASRCDPLRALREG